jgi:hypothetical protein
MPIGAEVSPRRRGRGRERGEFGARVDPALAAEVLMACYVDTLRRWLAVADPPFDLVLDGLTTR